MTQRVISFHYILTDPSGQTLDSSNEQGPLSFLEGANQIIPGLEKALQALSKGEKKKIEVPAADAYGLRDERFVLTIPRERFKGEKIQVGDEVASSEDPNAMPFKVVGLTDTQITLDANHPLAGVDLTFDVEIVDIRSATEEELTHGHVHGPHGHDH
jgi:FKBP-type peptidyl-prolyl cis-trans isomerase SlyD